MTDIFLPASVGPVAVAPSHPRSSDGARPPLGPAQDGDRQLDAACAQMESLFLHQLLQKMRATVDKTDLFGGGRAEELYTTMLDGEIAANLSRAGGIGLARMLQQQLESADMPGGGRDPKD